MNDNVVTSPLEHAKRHLSAVKATQAHLRGVYDGGAEVDRGTVARLHQSVRDGLKTAEVSALIGIGEQLGRIADHTEAAESDQPVTLCGEPRVLFEEELSEEWVRRFGSSDSDSDSDSGSKS